MHLAPIIRDLAVILGVAALVTLLFQRIRQPVVLGYIVAGFLISPQWGTGVLPFPLVSDLPNVRVWAEIGVIFLMFSLGLEFSFRKLMRVGISASGTALVEMSFMMLLGYTTGRALGWRNRDSIFLAAMLSISSTTIILRALDELKLKTRRFAEMIFAVLVVEDLVAILILVALSTLATSESISALSLLTSAGKLVLVMSAWFLTGYFAVPRFVRYFGRWGNDEHLLLLALGLCFSLVVAAASLEYSTALGAFIMGSILAETTESHRIEERLAPLRDLFSAIFFVSVGMLLDPAALRDQAGTIVILTGVVLGGKIVGVTTGALLTGQTLRTSMQVGFGMAQIGEFSFIIASLGLLLGVTSSFLYPVAVAVSVITAFTTPYLIRVSHRFAVHIEGRLPASAKVALSRYAAWTLERRADSQRRAQFYRLLAKWVISGIVVTLAFVLMAELGLPRLERRISSYWLAHALGWAAAMLASAPFVWAMFSLFREFRLSPAETAAATERGATAPIVPEGGTLLLFRFLTLLWIGALTRAFFPLEYALAITAALLTLLFVAAYRRLEASYAWFERTFLATFEPQTKSARRTEAVKRLAPWDAHLIRLKIHPNSEIAGHTLAEGALRKRFGINIVAIQRGLQLIVAPRPEQVMYPKDELLVLATDEQVEAVRGLVEKPPGLSERFSAIASYELGHLLITEDSPIAHKSIRDSGLRERFGSMAVGLERADRRMINPDSDLVLRPGDVLWVVGPIEQLRELAAGDHGAPSEPDAPSRAGTTPP